MQARHRATWAFLAMLSAGAIPAAAQTNHSHIGGRLVYDLDFEEFGIGAQAGIPVARRLEFYPSLTYFFVDVGSLLSVNADLKFRLDADRPNWFYVGGGLNVTRAGANGFHDTDTGLNLIGGYESLRGQVHPFGELRLRLGDGTQSELVGGINITLGR